METKLGPQHEPIAFACPRTPALRILHQALWKQLLQISHQQFSLSFTKLNFIFYIKNNHSNVFNLLLMYTSCNTCIPENSTFFLFDKDWEEAGAGISSYSSSLWAGAPSDGHYSHYTCLFVLGCFLCCCVFLRQEHFICRPRNIS